MVIVRMIGEFGNFDRINKIDNIDNIVNCDRIDRIGQKPCTCQPGSLADRQGRNAGTWVRIMMLIIVMVNWL